MITQAAHLDGGGIGCLCLASLDLTWLHRPCLHYRRARGLRLWLHNLLYRLLLFLLYPLLRRLRWRLLYSVCFLLHNIILLLPLPLPFLLFCHNWLGLNNFWHLRLRRLLYRRLLLLHHRFRLLGRRLSTIHIQIIIQLQTFVIPPVIRRLGQLDRLGRTGRRLRF
jgi:hypothetical protein